jgi:hypothetical protein
MSDYSCIEKRLHLLYSRAFRFLQHKTQGYFDQLNITNEHPYSIRIEMHERQNAREPLIIAVWQYPLYSDYLPVSIFVKVLRLTKSNMKRNPCSSNPCPQNPNCQQLQNMKLDYVCLCKNNFVDGNCSIPDQQCTNRYCSFGSICKSTYRGLLVGNELSYCICSFNQFGETRCEHNYTLVLDNKIQITSDFSPIKYHYICRNHTNLFYFRDDFYLCICDENHSRVECFLL